VSLLVLAPCATGFALVGDSFVTAASEALRYIGPVDVQPKTYVAHPRVALGINGVCVVDDEAVARRIGAACDDGARNHDLLALLDDEVPRCLRAVPEEDVRWAAELPHPLERAATVLALIAAEDGPIAVRYLASPSPDGFHIERDFKRSHNLGEPALLTLIGLVEYALACVEREALLAFEDRHVADVSTADALQIARLIHTRASMASVPVDVVRERLAALGLPFGFIGGPLTGVFVGAGGARHLTNDELRKGVTTMAGSTLLTGAVSTYGLYRTYSQPAPKK